jgi:hypothetical protein
MLTRSTHLAMSGQMAGLENLVDRHSAALTAWHSPKTFVEFLKEPNRKAVFRSGGGPPGVLLPFLTENRYEYNINCRFQASRPLSSDPQLVTSASLSKDNRVCKGFLKLFCSGSAGIRRSLLSYFKINKIRKSGLHCFHAGKSNWCAAGTSPGVEITQFPP